VKRLAIAALGIVAACSSAVGSDTSASTRPRLVVLLVIDQWPEWAFEVKRPELHAGGFDRLLTEGSWNVGRHPSAVTLTAPGHALLGTGEPSATSGIIANEWWRRDSGRVLQSVEAEDGSVSAKWLRVPGLGDAVAAANTGARAVSVSLKERAAVLPLGHAGTAIWYRAKTVDWASTTRPVWLERWNHAQPIAFHLHDVWEPLDAEQLRRLTNRRDYEIGEFGEKGFGSTFPHAIDRTRNPAEAILATPLGNELVLDTALAAIDGEQLGTDDVPDLLVVSLSAHDYIAHGWGHESWESWDAELRLDRALARFLGELDARIGAGRWAMVVTSDHGASHLPELVGGGRQRYSQIAARANVAASEVFGPGAWIANAEFPSIYLSDGARERSDADRNRAIDSIVVAVRDIPGIERVERAVDIAGGCDRRPERDRPLCLAIDLERSGEVVYLPAAGWVLEDDVEPMATSHGSPHDYDQLVPVLELAPGRVPHAPLAGPDGDAIAMTSIAPLLKAWLGLPR
jgi:predicted AlkP superfamily pyrophosphatase or phosphodiesterase